MKILVVYYSRSGITRRVALQIASFLQCDSEEIVDRTNRSGVVGFFRSGHEAAAKKSADIGAVEKDPALYDCVLIGTPVWAFTMSSPARAYIARYKDSFKSVGFFCTVGGKGAERALGHMREACGISPVVSFSVNSREALGPVCQKKIEEAFAKLKS